MRNALLSGTNMAAMTSRANQQYTRTNFSLLRYFWFSKPLSSYLCIRMRLYSLVAIWRCRFISHSLACVLFQGNSWNGSRLSKRTQSRRRCRARFCTSLQRTTATMSHSSIYTFLFHKLFSEVILTVKNISTTMSAWQTTTIVRGVEPISGQQNLIKKHSICWVSLKSQSRVLDHVGHVIWMSNEDGIKGTMRVVWDNQCTWVNKVNWQQVKT